MSLHIWDRFTKSGLVFLAVFTPLAFGSVPSWANLAMQVVVLLLFLVWFGGAVRSGELCVARLPLMVFLFCFVLLVLFQLIPMPSDVVAFFSSPKGVLYRKTLIVSGNAMESQWWASGTYTISLFPRDTLTSFGLLVSCIAVFWIVVHQIQFRSEVRFLLWVMILSGTFFSFVGIGQKLASVEMVYMFFPRNQSPFGPFINRNHFAGYVGMIIPLAVSLGLSGLEGVFPRTHLGNFRQWAVMWGDPRVGRCITLLCLSAFMATGLFLSLSRGGMISFLVSMMVMVLLLRIKGSSGFRSIIIAIFLGVIVLLVGWIGFEEIGARISTFWKPKGLESMMIRPAIWEVALRIHQDFPVFGTGLGTFASVFAYYRSPRTRWVTDLYVHNDYLQLLVETGYVGAALIAAAALLFAWYVIRRFSELRDPAWIPVAAGGIASGIALSIHSFVDFNFHIPAIAFHFSLIMGLLVVSLNLRGGEKNQRLTLSYIRISLKRRQRFLFVEKE